MSGRARSRARISVKRSQELGFWISRHLLISFDAEPGRDLVVLALITLRALNWWVDRWNGISSSVELFWWHSIKDFSIFCFSWVLIKSKLAKGRLAFNITTYPSILPVSLINEKLKKKVHIKCTKKDCWGDRNSLAYTSTGIEIPGQGVFWFFISYLSSAANLKASFNVQFQAGLAQQRQVKSALFASRPEELDGPIISGWYKTRTEHHQNNWLNKLKISQISNPAEWTKIKGTKINRIKK